MDIFREPTIGFVETNKEEIKEIYPSSFHEKARYFKATRNGKTLCFYGIINRTDDQARLNQAGLDTCEAFLMMGTFQGRVLSKGFFFSLFNHLFSLGYREIWTWTKWDRLIKLLARFEKLGIEQAQCPTWDKGPTVGSLSKVDLRQTKTWFIKRIDQEV
jgi:hypothetical protein